DRRGPEWQCIYFNVTDKSRGKKPHGAAAGKRAPGRYVVDECDTFTVPLQECCSRRTLRCLGLEEHQTNSPLIPPDEASPEPVLPSTVGITNLLVAAHGAFAPITVSASLGDPPAVENYGRAQWTRRQTHPLILTLFAQSGGER
ncbi:hypothetical protein GOODEAATRI_004991, partial [Goodea atripinnis]